MSFNEIGQQLRAYRMGSGLKAEEISARLGISRAALYRYEKGEVIKLDTITKLAELLRISPLTLLGIGVEYYTKPISFAERLRQIEETADHILQFFGPICYFLTSEQYDDILGQILEEHAASTNADAPTSHKANMQLMSVLQARKKNYNSRKPSVLAILTPSSIQKFLAQGIAPAARISASTRSRACKIAHTEMERLADLMESEPLGLQLSIVAKEEPNGPFALLRSGERVSLVINPFSIDSLPAAQSGVAMVTNAEDAIKAHHRISEYVWPETLKGAAAARKIRDLIMESYQCPP